MSGPKLLRGASAALALAVLAAGCGEREGGAAPPAAPPAAEEAGPLAPDFTLFDLEGREVSLRSFRGRTVLLDFWATWCTPCVYQIPVLNEFYTNHRNEGVEVIGISVDAEGERVVAPFAEAHGIRYRVLLGSETVARRFGAPGFPSLVVIDPQGHIANLHVGLIEREGLEELVGPLAGGGRWSPPGDDRGRALADSAS